MCNHIDIDIKVEYRMTETSEKEIKIPSINRQKTFIVDNAGILDYENKRTIIMLVMMHESSQNAIFENRTAKNISIDLDQIDNPDLILQLYNIVNNKRNVLNQPVR